MRCLGNHHISGGKVIKTSNLIYLRKPSTYLEQVIILALQEVERQFEQFAFVDSDVVVVVVSGCVNDVRLKWHLPVCLTPHIIQTWKRLKDYMKGPTTKVNNFN